VIKNPAVTIKQINLDNPKKYFLLIPAFLFVVTAVFIFRWGMGSTIAEQANNIELLTFAKSWSPHDPQILHEEGQVWLKAGDEKKVVSAYETAVSLSPGDYRLWLALGLARDRAGDTSGAEKAIRQAISLAPYYGIPHWQLGNSLLRQGRLDEAFAELRIAAYTMKTLQAQVAGLAWQAYGTVPAAIDALGGDPAMRAELAKFLAQQNKLNEALIVWTGLNEAERQAGDKAGQEILVACLKTGRWRAAWELNKTLATDGTETTPIAAFSNPGFEGDILQAGRNSFGWQIEQGIQPVVVVDASQRRSGTRSLLMLYSSTGGFDFRNISQIVIVEPNARYRLECFYKTLELKAVGPVKLEVIDAIGANGLIGSSDPIPDGTREWQPLQLEFNTSEKTEAVTVRFSRVPCADNNCPIFGRIWYDDFSLQRIN